MRAPPSAGILFSHLVELVHNSSRNSIGEAYTANDFKDALLAGLLQDANSGSYADHLWQTQGEGNLIKARADYFVSYVWAVDLRDTLAALQRKFTNNKEEVYIWMDFVCVDQHAGTREVIDFATLESVFGNNLAAIGKAMIVMIPATRPIAATRAWCCFEWYTMVSKKIEYEFCVRAQDEEDFVQGLIREPWLMYRFRELFMEVNVTKASAREPVDNAAIQALIAKAGTANVNNVVMLPIKEMLRRFVDDACALAKTPEQIFNATYSQASLHASHADYVQALRTYEQAANLAESKENANLAHFTIGSQLHRLGRHEEALAKFETVLREREERGEDEARIADVLDSMASVYASQTNYAKALETYTRVLALQRACLVPDLMAQMETLVSMGDAFIKLGKTDEALREFESALAHVQRELGTSDLFYAKVLNSLSIALMYKKRYEEAYANFEKVLAIQLLVLGEGHAHNAYVFTNMGLVRMYQGEYDAALVWLNKALEIEHLVLGEDHVEVAATLLNLGNVYSRLKNHQEALRVLNRALQIQKSKKGVEEAMNMDIGRTLSVLGTSYHSLGKYTRAEKMYARAIEVLRNAHGVSREGGDNVEIATAVCNRGLALYQLQRWVEARDALEQALLVLETERGENADLIMTALDALARSLWEVEELERAAKEYKRLLEMQKNDAGSGKDAVAKTLRNLGGVMQSLARMQDAFECYQRAIALYSELPQGEFETEMDEAKQLLEQIRPNAQDKRKHRTTGCAMS